MMTSSIEKSEGCEVRSAKQARGKRFIHNGHQAAMILNKVFADIEPIPQDDGPRSVCAIDYPLAYEEAMGYLRAIMRADEQSGTSF
jgi:hypothetical protein